MALDNIEIKKMKAKAHALEPVVRIGKNGLTDSIVQQVKRVLLARKLVKVRLLRSFVESNDRKKTAKELAVKTGAELIDQVGFTVVLYKR
ncbi:MAG: YhbY family RNA-binding protein [Candidatus Woesearchaeota archaeon]